MTEQYCSHATLLHGYTVVCMRKLKHKGEHIFGARQAAEADGVCWCCRKPADEGHLVDCPEIAP